MDQIRDPAAYDFRQTFMLSFRITFLSDDTCVLLVDFRVKKFKRIYRRDIWICITSSSRDQEITLIIQIDFHVETVSEFLIVMVVDGYFKVGSIVFDADTAPSLGVVHH